MTALIDVDQLRTFIAIAETGSFTRAAEVVNKTQSEVSMQMKRLEERIRRPIFARDGRASKLTEDGQRLLDYARRIVKLNMETVAAFSGGPEMFLAASELSTVWGPITAPVRDSLDFVNFNEFKNQIQWAEFGKAFNNHLNAVTLEKLPREALEGKKVDAVGAYPLPSKGQLPLLTPVTIAIGG